MMFSNGSFKFFYKLFRFNHFAHIVISSLFTPRVQFHHSIVFNINTYIFIYNSKVSQSALYIYIRLVGWLIRILVKSKHNLSQHSSLTVNYRF